MKDEGAQLDLFRDGGATRTSTGATLVARARSTDPLTSFEAAGHVERTGIAHGQRAKCLEIVKKHPGTTSGEIAELADLDRHAAARRLPELRQAGLVRNGEQRVCRISDTRQITWWPMGDSR